MEKIIENAYPVKIELNHSIGEGIVISVIDSGVLLSSKGAIKLLLTIDNYDYPKEEVKVAVKEICLKALECFC